MMEIVDLLFELLTEGTIKIQIQISLTESPGTGEKFIAHCGKCGWKSRPRGSEGAKARSLRAHSHHCKGTTDHPEWLVEQMKLRNKN